MTEKLVTPTVKDLMFTEVITVAPDASLDDLITTLIQRNIPAAPVVEERDGERELLGFITERDCLEYFSNEIYYGNPDVCVQSMMQRFPLCVSPDTDVFAVATIFTRHPHRYLPVVQNKQVVGMVGRRDVLRGLYEFERKVCTQKAKSKCLKDFRELVNLRFIIK
jgi:CBS domain-containing protein